MLKYYIYNIIKFRIFSTYFVFFVFKSKQRYTCIRFISMTFQTYLLMQKFAYLLLNV